MDLSTIKEVYTKLSSDPALLQNGKAFLENLLHTEPLFLIQSLMLSQDSSCPIQMRQFVGVLVKNLIKDNWDTHPALTSQQKQAVRETVLKGVLQVLSEPKILEISGLIISELIIREGIEIWIPNLIELINVLFSSKEYSASLDFFSILFSKVDNRIHVLAPKLIPILISLTSQEILIEKVLVLFYLTLSSFSFADGTNNAFVKEALHGTFETWLQLFVGVLRSPIDTHLASKRYVMKILTVFFRDFTYFSKTYLRRLIGDVWLLLNKIPVIYSKTVLENEGSVDQSKGKRIDDEYFEEVDEDWECEVEGLTIQLFEFFLTVLNKPEIEGLIFSGLLPLTNTLVQLLMTTKSQEKKWVTDPNQFISEDEDEANLRSVRNGGLKLLSHIIEYFGHNYVKILLAVIDQLLLKANYFSLQLKSLDEAFTALGPTNEFIEAAKFADIKALFMTSAFNSETFYWKRKEVAFLLLGSFSEDILDYQNANQEFEVEGLIRNILKELVSMETNEKILEARGLWCLTKFAGFLEENQVNLFEDLIKTCYVALRQAKFAALKLVSAKACATFLFKAWKKELLNGVSKTIDFKELIQEFIGLFSIASEETLHIVLEGIEYLLKISPENRKMVAVQAMSYLFKSFQIFHNEVLIGTLIQEILEILVEESETFLVVFEAFWPLISQVFQNFENHINTDKEKLGSLIKPNDISLITNLIDILKIIVKSKRFADFSEKQKVFGLLPCLITIVLFNEDVALSVHANICLKYFVISFRDELKKNYANDLINLLLKLTQNSNENGLLYLGNLFMVIDSEIFENGLRDPTLLINILRILLNHTKMPSIVQNLLLIFSRMINLNPAHMFDFLWNLIVDPTTNTNGIHIFLNKLVEYQTLIKGKIVKNSLYLALTKIFFLKDARLESLIIHETNAPLKIVLTLIKALNDETFNKTKIRSIDFENMLYGEECEENHQGGGGQAEAYQGEDFEDTLGQIDEEGEGKTLAEDFELLGDLSLKLDLQEVLKDFFKLLINEKANLLMMIAKEERAVLEKNLSS